MIRIRRQGIEHLDAHLLIPIRFSGTSRLSLEALRRGELLKVPVPPFEKDYDALGEEPLSRRLADLDPKCWALLTAFEGEEALGGAVVICRSPEFDLRKGPGARATLQDLRVLPAHRGRGIGAMLFEAAAGWARNEGCTELLIETQDNNVAACRFYAAMGCEVADVQEHAYLPVLDEARILWRKPLIPQP